MKLDFIPIKTKKVVPPQEDIFPILINELKGKIEEGDVLLITSKILGIHQGRSVHFDDAQKDELILQESESFIPREFCPNKQALLTIKNSVLIPSAGIDESNSDGYFVMYPDDVDKLLQEIHAMLCKEFSLKKLAIIATDSHSMPLRWGVMGVSIGSFGLKPYLDKSGTPDIFGRKLCFTKINVVDSLSSLGVTVMGEANEQTPLLIIRGADFVEFSDKKQHEGFLVSAEEDMFAPLLEKFEVNIYLGLGSSIGNAEQIFSSSEKFLKSHGIRIIKKSNNYQNKPIGNVAKNMFTNAVWHISTTDKNPRNLLKILKECEKNHGRNSKKRWADRELDLDILMFGNTIMDEENLQIPHREIPKRDFVLKPWTEIVHEYFCVPKFGKLTTLLAHLNTK